MSSYYCDSDKYGDEAEFAIVEAFHGAIRDKVRRHLAATKEPWNEFVFGSAETVIDGDALREFEARLLELGHRYDYSAIVSVQERPQAYKQAAGISTDDPDFCFEHPDAPTAAADASGRELCGVGDNVVGYSENLHGTARYVRSTEHVLRYLADGVPANTVAVIDDSGGTLTAPILEQFAGVICAGGTVRSHLGILTREYGIPCLMNAKVSGIKEGDEVMLETTAIAKTAEAYQQGIEVTANVWRMKSEAG